ncbi:MAG TPA: hypothetical protein VEY49_11400, partial [Solirubrobacteraceae bacterium]|nr:hypothetical protein [Solirubrobacteraceae bacterium]
VATVALSVEEDAPAGVTLERPRLTIPAGGRREAVLQLASTAPGGLASGRLVARNEAGGAVLAHPFSVATEPPEPPVLGPLALQRRDGRVTGVRFALGAFERGDPLAAGTRVALTERVALTLVRARDDRVVRRLTPPGGARELLPGEYAYELPRTALRALPPDRFSFRAVARSPRGGQPAVVRSEPFGR